jgi:8-oxo-dGTP diphosphatase
VITFCPQCATRVEERRIDGKLRPACPSCGYIAFVDPKVAATVLIESDGSVLLVRRSIEPARGLWCFPGGHVDFAEDPVVAATRECQEEAGLTVHDLALLDVSFNGRVIVITYITNSFEPDDPQAGDDADQVAWFSPTDLPPIAFAAVSRALDIWRERLVPGSRL